MQKRIGWRGAPRKISRSSEKINFAFSWAAHPRHPAAGSLSGIEPYVTTVHNVYPPFRHPWPVFVRTWRRERSMCDLQSHRIIQFTCVVTIKLDTPAR